MAECLLGKSLSELQEVALSVGLQKFAGKQLAEWLYVRRVSSFDEMTNISLKGREALKSNYVIGRHAPVREAVSVDGTRKYLFETSRGVVEAVYIPEDDRATLCVSSQVGCKMGCRFCMTGTLGFHGHLSAADILNQIFEIDALAVSRKQSALSNLVFMGEGEPMDNLDQVLRTLEIMTADYGCAWSPKRITVSTVGIPAMKRFLDESECHLAVSMHNPFSAERAQIMPADKMYSITQVVSLLRQYDWTHQRRVSFEYICWGGSSGSTPENAIQRNDTPRHAQELLRLLKGLDCRINLIRFHEGVDRAFPASDEKQMVWLRDYLTEHGITTTIRRSRGEDILAACGMLVNALQKD
ncbi:MAG: 23S rRNA (adenine(2503)-C(2))-methyltransferase RlmN [Paludibacteraceae bacterium]|nr:23S rRNA (adenine(2503)-C(2))-methyltransferase RlmN [Paludibacteraceae bacterium]